MQLKLSDLEIDMLRKLVNGEAVSVSSQQRPFGIAGYGAGLQVSS